MNCGAPGSTVVDTPLKTNKETIDTVPTHKCLDEPKIA
jgi:hypothetical protein